MMQDLQRPRDDRSLGELFSDLTREVGTLVRQEIELARTEMSTKASRVGKDAGMTAGGVALAYAGLLAILAGVIGLLSLVLPFWASALLVGLVVAAAGGFLAKQGLDAFKKEDLVPRETLETLKEDRSAVNTLRRAA